jgi:two-component system LytT family response regulator
MTPIYIIEDEPPAAEKLRLFLHRAAPEASVEVFHDGRDALRALDRQRPELMFLDIEMPGLTGLELLEQLPEEERPLVILTSAYEKYALSGFRLSVTDYLLKPYSYARFEEALAKARRALRLRALDRAATPAAPPSDTPTEAPATMLTVRTDLRTERLDTAELLYVEAVGDYVRLVTPTRRLLTQQTLTALEARLPQGQFCRIHRSYIVRTDAVVAFDAAGVTLTDGTHLAVGRTYRARTAEILRTLFGTERKSSAGKQ